MSDFRSFCEETHRVHETKLLSPLSARHPNIFLKESFHGPLAGSACLAELRESATVARIGNEYLSYAGGSWIHNVWELQRNCLHLLELIDDDVDQVLLPSNVVSQIAGFAGVKNQLS